MGEVHDQYLGKQLTEETWRDFEALFEKHKGVRGGCWCTFHQVSSTDYNRMSKNQRKAFHEKRVQEGIATGLILYNNNDPVGWCQFGRGEIFEQINRNRAYKKLDSVKQVKADWRITCIFVDKDHRKKGLSRCILSEALKLIEDLGGGVVEAFPFDLPNSEKPNYNGTVSLFEREGFHKVDRLGKNIQLMRKNLKMEGIQQ